MFNFKFPKIQSQRLAIKLNVVGERSLRSGHPWIFSDSIEKINVEGKSGDIAIIFSHSKNKPIGVGLYDPDSPIRLKILHNDAAKIDSEFFQNRIQNSFAIRAELLNNQTTSYRLIFGENDGFPGLIADVYSTVMVVKLYSKIWMPFLEMILAHLIEVSHCDSIVIRLNRNLQKLGCHGLKDGQLIYGVLASEEVLFIEHGVRFSANVCKGHKTGYFLDHRHNRKRVGAMATGKTMLDVFAYAGGFSIHALVQGAKEVTSLDISEQALTAAKENARLNSYKGVHKTITGDAFQQLQQLITDGKKFDLVVIDPPSFAKSKGEIEGAKRKYIQLAQLGAQLTGPNGTLVLASCSSRISSESFFQLNETALKVLRPKYSLIASTDHDVDHPISFAEGAYLKCGYYRFKT